MTSQIQRIEELTRDAVREVFISMLSLKLTDEPPAPLANESTGQIAGSVGFIGQANGVIYLFAEVDFARILTARMLGISEAEVEEDEMVNDAIGELSNMIGGYVKSRLCDAGWSCILTIPSIVRGQQLSIERVAQITRRVLRFSAESHQVLVELLVKEPSA